MVGGSKQWNKAAQRSTRCWLDEWHWRRRGHRETDSAGWERGGRPLQVPELDRVTGPAGWAHPRGVQGWGEGSEQDLHDDLGFTKTILLLETLQEAQIATPITIYNDSISPRKHRLTPESKKKLGKVRGFLCIHSFNPLNHPRRARRLFPFDRWRNWGTEIWRLCNSLVIDLRSTRQSKVRVWGDRITRAVWSSHYDNEQSKWRECWSGHLTVFLPMRASLSIHCQSILPTPTLAQHHQFLGIIKMGVWHRKNKTGNPFTVTHTTEDKCQFHFPLFPLNLYPEII